MGEESNCERGGVGSICCCFYGKKVLETVGVYVTGSNRGVSLGGGSKISSDVG